jgi:hypothetical protein
MRQTVLAVYDRYADAHSTQRALSETGVPAADIAIYSISPDAHVEKGPRIYAPGTGAVHSRKPVFDRLDQLFVRLFPGGNYPPEVAHYREFVRRGGSIVSADAMEAQVDQVVDMMRRGGAADIEERAAAWRNHHPEADKPKHVLHRRNATVRDDAGQHVLHAAQPGGAGASGPARTAAAEGAEIRGTGVSSASSPTTGGMQQVTTRTGDSTASEAEAAPGTESSSGAKIVRNPLDANQYDSEFREDYDTHYAKTGTPYDEYQRAYTHGASLGHDERYREFDWQRVEPSARENWESRYPGSGWERFKAAVKHGWERVRRV